MYIHSSLSLKFVYNDHSLNQQIAAISPALHFQAMSTAVMQQGFIEHLTTQILAPEICREQGPIPAILPQSLSSLTVSKVRSFAL